MFQWFNDTLININADKCHLFVSTNNTVKINIGNFDITNSKSEQQLGIKFDHKLLFGDHISELCKNDSEQRNSNIINSNIIYELLMNAIFKSQFSYFLFAWMCRIHANNSKINRLYECCLRIIYFDKQLSFEKLLEKDGSVSIHKRNLQILETEMYKIKNDLSSLIITELFEQRNEPHYDLRNNAEFTIHPIKTVYDSSKTISFLGPKI